MGKYNYYVFKGCSSINELYIGDNVKEIPDYAFIGCSGLTSVVIPDGVTSIGDYAFYGCSNLTSVVIGNGVTSIGKDAFRYCNNLTGINYNAQKVFSGVFSNNSNLLLVVLGNNVTSIDENAFSDCSSLKRIIIPKSVTEIEKGAFSDCTGIETVEYGGSESDWKEIYIGANNENLTNAKFIYNSSLSNTTLTDTDYLTYTTNDDNTVTITDCYQNATSINIPKEIDGLPVTTINANAFANRTKLKSVTIPDSVTTLGKSAFEGCSALTKIFIPDSITTIPNAAFYNCSSLTSVTIPATVTTVEDYAFYGCNSLKNVYYNDEETNWNKINFGYSNDNLQNSVIHYNSVAPTPIPLTTATVTKSETDNTWSFEVSVTKAYENSYVYAAVYDSDDNLIAINKVPLNVSAGTTIEVDKSTDDSYAKIFVWTDNMQPIIEAENVVLNTEV
jgi:hypothetical protein